MAKGAIIVADLEKKDGELQQLRRKLADLETAPTPDVAPAQPAAAAAPQDDLALREAIARLAADVVRLSNAAEEEPRRGPGRGKSRRRPSQAAPSSQGPDAPKAIGAAKLRQLQPTAPER
jgi:uncharacterized membrane protein